MWTRAAIALGLVALTLAVFLQVRRHDFVDFDDLTDIARNEDLRASSPADALRLAFTKTISGNWVPLTILSLQSDRALYGSEPAGYLLTQPRAARARDLLLFAGAARA